MTIWKHERAAGRCKQCNHWRAVHEGLCPQCFPRERRAALEAQRLALRIKRRAR